MPTLIVFVVGDGCTNSGQRKSLNVAVTEKIDTTPRIGRDTGNTIDHNVRIGPAPSIAAALSMSCGMESKNRFSRKMLNALVTAGSQIAHGVFSRFHWKIGRSMTVTYCGMTSTVAGIISVASIAPSTTLPSTGRSLEKAYAAVTPNTSWNAS